MSAGAARPPSVLIHTTSLMAWPGGDHTVCLAAINDGLTLRTPGLTPDQAEAFAALIREAAARCRSNAAAAAAAAATSTSSPTARAGTPAASAPAHRSRLI